MAEVKQDQYNITKDRQDKQYDKRRKRTRKDETDYPGSKKIPIKPDELPIEKQSTP